MAKTLGEKETLENGQLRMYCNLRPPEPRHSFSALCTTPCQVWSCWAYPLPYYSVFAADTLLYAVTLTFDLWLWTFAVYRLWSDETLYQIWIAISIFDLITLNAVYRVALGSEIIFTKFDLRQLIRTWIIGFLMLIRYVTLWPWPLIRWPWKFVVHQASRD